MLRWTLRPGREAGVQERNLFFIKSMLESCWKISQLRSDTAESCFNNDLTDFSGRMGYMGVRMEERRQVRQLLQGSRQEMRVPRTGVAAVKQWEVAAPWHSS